MWQRKCHREVNEDQISEQVRLQTCRRDLVFLRIELAKYSWLPQSLVASGLAPL